MTSPAVRLPKVKRFGRQPALNMVRAVVECLSFRKLRVGRIYLLRLDGPPRVSAAHARGPGEVRSGLPSDAESLARCGGHPARRFLDRFQLGDYCAVAAAGDRIIGYEWFSTRPEHLADPFKYRVVLPPDCIYAYDAFILPPYRASGVWMKFKLHLAGLMKRLECGTVLTYVEHGNWLSLRSHLRLGFVPLKTVLVTSVWGKGGFRERAISVSELHACWR